jgi:hypothetical protein
MVVGLLKLNTPNASPKDIMNYMDQAKYTRPSDIAVFPVYIKDDLNHSAFLPFQLGSDVVLSKVLSSKLDH